MEFPGYGVLDCSDNPIIAFDPDGDFTYEIALPSFDCSYNASTDMIYVCGNTSTFYDAGDDIPKSTSLTNSITLPIGTHDWNLNCEGDTISVWGATNYSFTITDKNFTFKRMECGWDSTVPKSIVYTVLIYVMVFVCLFALYTKIPILNILVGFIMCYFSWTVAPCFQFAVILFIGLGITNILYGGLIYN